MKPSRSKVCSVLLSMGIIASSIVVPAYAAESKEFIPKVAATDSYESPSFMIGELSEKSSESHEKIVEKNYSKKLQGSGKYKEKKFKQNKKFKNSMGRTVISTIQTFNGFPVFGTDQNFHINDEGVIECVAGSNVDDLEKKVKSTEFTAKYSQKDVLNVIENHLGFAPKYEIEPKPEIILYPINGEYLYTYQVKVKSIAPYYKDCTYYVDANNLSLLKVDNHIANAEQPASGSGVGQSGDDKSLKMVRNDDGSYSLKNTYEKLGTYNAAKNAFNNVNLEGLFSEPDNYFNSGTDQNCQQDAVDAHYTVTNTRKFFSNAPFFRKGNDDLNSDITVCVVKNSTEVNAYGGTNYIEFHPGHGSAGKSTSFAQDVAAHEFTHGMLFSEGLSYNYNSENGALHEGLSDVFGILAEYFVPSEGPFDWYLGEDTGTTFRDCANPGIDDYNDYTAQSPGAHAGGGVVTKAANLMAVGGTHNNISVIALGYGKLARIFYNAINDGYLTSNMTYTQFANYIVQAANLLYGGNSQAYQSTKDAFTAVGLLQAPPTSFRLMYVNGMQVQLAWSGTSGARYGVYRKSAGTNNEPALIATTTSSTGLLVDTLSGSCDFYVAYIDQSGNRISTFSNAVNVEKLTKSAPTNFAMSFKSGLSVQFSWNGTTGDKFAIYRKVSGTSDEFVKVGETTSKVMSVDTLIGKCDFKVAVVDSNGTRLSPFSNVVAVQTYGNPPQNFKIRSQGGMSVTFEWDGENTANRYALYRVLTGSINEPEKVSETRNTAIVTATTSGTYDYFVAVVDLEGNRTSLFSNVVMISK
ncbi:MAG TPA: M4 family metallopeptidase [Pseudobacteroides sp.]|uniref:M4 family metallopeptidase n=1 Tax=Pseudobacteroides sp. TaxID=1968840 RepID=UPI002F9271A6